MAGIYVHIPFCKQACHYCDFHFSTNTRYQQEMVSAIAKELALQRAYLSNDKIDTVYFGGGTPSILTEGQLHLLLDAIGHYYDVSNDAEITLEANPDDLSAAKLKSLVLSGVNRLSIGIQSFHPPNLKFLNRVHSAQEAHDAVRLSQQAGIENISIDLIYAIPGGSHKIWEEDINKALALGVPHISAYNLTIEEKTVFGNWAKKGKIAEVPDEDAARQFEMLMDILEENSYEHYEISNFAKPKMHSRHNSAYWRAIPYLGVGPGAHAYNGSSRQYNVSSNAKYLKSLAEDFLPFEKEVLSGVDMANEYLLISLRTIWGCQLSKLAGMGFPIKGKPLFFLEKYIAEGYLLNQNETIFLTRKGKFIADKIIEDLWFSAE